MKNAKTLKYVIITHTIKSYMKVIYSVGLLKDGNIDCEDLLID